MIDSQIIDCHHCFESFEIQIDQSNALNQIVWDCEVCCNPNLITYIMKNNNLIHLEITDDND